MRKNSDTWSVTCGVKSGHHHLYKGSNCQDSAVIAAVPAHDGLGQITIGIGCDGCGEGSHSEMGAIAIANFALRECLQDHSRQRSPTQILKHLFPAIVRFIDTNVFLTCPGQGVEGVADFIKHHWLATIVGFILTDDENVMFWCGDGAFAINDEGIIEIDQNNKPSYIAYNSLFLPEQVGVTNDDIPIDFDKMTLGPISRVMVASDGFTTFNPDKLARAREREELPDSLHGQQWGKKGQFGLKKWMNSRSDRGYFDDDCFIITAEKICNE